MRINLAKESMDMERRDFDFLLSAYMRSYLLESKSKAPKEVVFPLFQSVPHPYDEGIVIPVRYVKPGSAEAVDIEEDGSNVPTEPSHYRVCSEPHLRDYPGCFEECGLDECEVKPKVKATKKTRRSKGDTSRRKRA